MTLRPDQPDQPDQPDAGPDARLEQFLDGTLDEAGRLEIERELARRNGMQGEVELQSRIDESLRRSFAPPRITVPAAPAAPPRRRVGSWLAAAAGLAMLVTGAALMWIALRPAAAPDYGPWRSLEEVHAAADTGALEYWVREDRQEFIETFTSHYGQALALAELPDSVEALGLAYCRSLSSKSTCVLGRVDGRTVVVVVDRLERDGAPPPNAESGLNRFRRTVGALVMYEITPHAEPALLEHLETPGWHQEETGP